jgi:hypothetical protein
MNVIQTGKIVQRSSAHQTDRYAAIGHRILCRRPCYRRRHWRNGWLRDHGSDPSELSDRTRHRTWPKGVRHSLAEIKAIGHRLCLGYNEARKHGLDAHFRPEAEDVSVLDALDTLYSDKRFEYIETGPKTFPVFGPLQHFARELLLAITRAIPQGELLLRGQYKAWSDIVTLTTFGADSRSWAPCLGIRRPHPNPHPAARKSLRSNAIIL